MKTYVHLQYNFAEILMRNFTDNTRIENQDTHFVFNNVGEFRRHETGIMFLIPSKLLCAF
jgi:hypothetical protein